VYYSKIGGRLTKPPLQPIILVRGGFSRRTTLVAKWRRRLANGVWRAGRLWGVATIRPNHFPVILVSALSAGLLVLAFPSFGFAQDKRFGLFPLAWIALVPWLGLLPALSFRGALLSSLNLGFLFFAGLVYWVALFGYLPWALLSLYQALFIAAAGVGIWLCRSLGRGWRILAAASFWTLFEWLRGQGPFGFAQGRPFGFTWGWLGYCQSPWLDFIQLARIAGVPGLSFLIVLHNASLAEAIFSPVRSFRWRLAPLVTAWMLIAATVLMGRFGAYSARDGPSATLRVNTPALQPRHSSLKVSVIQPSAREPRVEDVFHPWSVEDIRFHLSLLEGLTRQAAPAHPNLIIWPESALPAILNRDLFLREQVGEIARQSRAWLLLGAPFEDEEGNLYNSAFLFSPAGRITDRYDKVQLVPFGEFVPGRGWLPGLRYYPIRESDLTPGKGFHPLWMGSTGLGISICFESIFPHISRSLVKHGAGLLVIITNDGWFKRTAAPAQHRQMAVFRAVETGRWVARAASTGISCVISPRGQIVKEIGLFHRGVLTERAGLARGDTLFVRHGDWFILAAAVLALGCILRAFWLHPRHSDKANLQH